MKTPNDFVNMVRQRLGIDKNTLDIFNVGDRVKVMYPMDHDKFLDVTLNGATGRIDNKEPLCILLDKKVNGKSSLVVEPIDIVLLSKYEAFVGKVKFK